ncbi:Indoleamine 2,3-dioxygenase [Thamnocephalis sphaerospora]|uniref:Indoleamine 2,3-dioxygenase n=1 Tax=Thamnocephalis sphaerospora TaxID=78915 RepID=A0A4P9XUX5_9FUNG|nr:Indoleamine 2,3-dioxygenase [Thamnocephalis sphaerospora]|eukprot:RKP09782.1 Indoleamine 2,3-dioxygenase [Thamnocephalis sphaerospora]
MRYHSSVLPQSLAEYEIDPVTGFLPPEEPLRRLPADGPFELWERLADDFQGLMLSGQLRKRVHELPVLDVDALTTQPQRRRAFLVLSLLTHAYVWGKHEPVLSDLPPCLAVPFCKVSEMLGLCPVVCNAAVVIWNWKRIDPNGPYDLSNMTTLHTFSGAMDESWFYLITTAIEARGGRALGAIVGAAAETKAEAPCLDTLAQHLSVLADEIEEMGKILIRMYERCDPYVFFWKVRAYLAGWANMKEAGLPDGLHYEGVDAPGVYRQYPGGSAGQSALMHALDIALGVKHHRTGSSSGRNKFMEAMRDHMPGPHRKFLEDLERNVDIRGFVDQLSASPAAAGPYTIKAVEHTTSAYNRCVDQLKQFRDRHIQMVTLYVVMPARKGPVVGGYRGVDTRHTGLARPSDGNNVHRGTGGTDVMPFLKQMRDETRATKLNALREHP